MSKREHNTQQGLPSGYKKLKWLESKVQGSVIVCDFYFNVNYKISGQFSFTNNIGSNFSSICGNNSSGSLRIGNVLFSPSAKRFDSVFGNYRGQTFSDTYTYDDIIYFEVDKTQCIIGDEYFTNLSYSGTQSSTYFQLFQFDGTSRVPYLRMYWLKIHNNNTIIHNLVPAMREQDLKLGMYDIATDVFYQANGTFTYE